MDNSSNIYPTPDEPEGSFSQQPIKSNDFTLTQASDQPKVIVNQVSELPYLSGQKKTLALRSVIVILILFLGFKGYGIATHNNRFGGTGNTPQSPILPGNSDIQVGQPVTDPASPTPAVTPSPSTESTTTPTKPGGAATTTPTVTPTKVFCGVSGMPEGVCTVITSIENSGVKGNPYVEADTSKVPPGAKTTVDEKTWVKTSDNNGQVNFTISLLGQSIIGIAYLQNKAGTWKVISYATN